MTVICDVVVLLMSMHVYVVTVLSVKTYCRNESWAGLAIYILTVLIVTFKCMPERKYVNVVMFSAIK